MLCKKPAPKGLVLHFILLVIPAVALSFDVTTPYPLPPKHQDHLTTLLWHDTVKAPLPDTLAAQPLVPAIGLNKHVTGFVKSYLEKEDEYLQKMKGRSRSYFQTIESVLAHYNLPLQLKYLAVVESKLQPKALSHAGARGLWQLMPHTARGLGLKVAGKTDQRLHTYRSTVAAARYLRDLYATFGDWLLVLAAYNAGPGTVFKAIKKAGSKNFWVLQRFLPAESRGHVKRFIGVHYFFEGEGSIATQTKAEAKAWQEKWGAVPEARQQETTVQKPGLQSPATDLVSYLDNIRVIHLW